MPRILSFEERHERALQWPFHMRHYARELWKIRNNIDPPLSWRELIPLATKHVRSFVWGYIRYVDLYLPVRKKELKS